MTQALSTQLETLIDAITSQSKKGKASGGSATAIQCLNLPSTMLNEVIAKNGGPLITFRWECRTDACWNNRRTC
jgi:hypothetical protein